MISGYFSGEGARKRPFVDAIVQLDSSSTGAFEVPLLVDTGADRTVLSPLDVLRIQLSQGVDLELLDPGVPAAGVGGTASTSVSPGVLRLGEFSTALQFTLIEPPTLGSISRMPSLLGRDVISMFGLYMDQRRQQIFLLDENEVNALGIPGDLS